MPRALHKLTDVSVKAERKPGRHSDGGGLYLNVSSTGGKSWLFMWVPPGRKRREMGLGAYPTVTLAKARAKAAACRATVEAGGDPLADKDKEAEPTFAEASDRYIASIESEWRNAKHKYQWEQTLGPSYCAAIRDKRVSEIDTSDVLKVLTPIWGEKNETAARLRGRIERVLDYSRVKGWRDGENPARWRGHLRNTLPKRQKLQRGHLPAMPYAKVPAFLQRIRGAEALAARALEFTILTATRSGEVLGATWSEIDLDRKVWSIPKERMKAGQAHSVPLSGRAVELLSALKEAATGDYVFPGEKSGKPLSNMSMAMFMRRLKVTDVTVHGFRSSFRDWCGDATTFPRELAEAALAHHVGSEVERAYRRADALEKRRKLMQAWADYLSAVKAGNVISIRSR
jgi:integrase